MIDFDLLYPKPKKSYGGNDRRDEVITIRTTEKTIKLFKKSWIRIAFFAITLFFTNLFIWISSSSFRNSELAFYKFDKKII